MAYRAEIEIGVKGAIKLEKLQNTINALANRITKLNDESIFDPVDPRLIQNVQNYSNALDVAAENLRAVALETEEETKAIQSYVTALGEANAVRARQNRLIDEQIAKQTAANRVVREASTGFSAGRYGPQVPAGTGRQGDPEFASSAVDPSRGVAIQKDRLALEKALLNLQERKADSVFEELKNTEALVRSANEAKLIAAEAAGKRLASDITLRSPERARKEERTTRAEEIAQEAIARGKAASDEFNQRRQNLDKIAEFAKQNEAKVFQVKAKGIRRELDLEFKRMMETTKQEIEDIDRVFQKKIKDDKKEQERFTQRLNERVRARKQADKEVADNQKKLDKQAQARRNKARDIASSAIIGGVFPLLFGQGFGASAGGGIGGLAGGIVGGQAGFALSLLGTQLGTFVDSIVAGAGELGQALNPLTADIKALAAASGEANTEVGKALESIEQFGTKTQALELATQLLADTVGTQGVAALQNFGDDTTRLADAFSAAMAQMQAAFAQAFGGILGGLADFLQKTVDVQAGLANETDPQLQLLKAQRQAAAEQANPANVVDAVLGTPLKTLEDIEKIEGQIADRVKEIRTETEKRILGANNILKTQNAINSLGLQDTEVTKLQTKLFGLKNDLTNSEVAATKKALINRKEELKIEQAKKAFTTDGKLDTKGFDEASERIRNEFAAERVRLETQIEEAQERAAKKAQTASDRAASQAERLTKQQAEQERRSAAFTNDLQNQLDIITVAGSVEAKRLQIERQYQRTLVRISSLKNQDYATQQKSLADQIRQRQEANLEAETQRSRAKAIRDAATPIRDIREQHEATLKANKEYNRLLMEGVLPSEARRISEFNKQVELQLKQVEEAIKLTELDILRAKSNGSNTKALEEQLELYKKQREAIEGAAAEGPGAAAPDQDPKAVIKERVGQLQEEINTMTNLGNVAVTVADNIGGAFSTAFQDVANGSKSTQEALADMFKTIGESFVKMAAEIIAKQLIMITLQTILKALGAASGGSGGGDVPFDTSTPLPGGMEYGALANGGFAKAGQPYIVGEEGPERFIPGTSGLVSNNDQFEAARAALVDGAGLSDEEKEAIENPGTSQQPSRLNQILKDSRSAVQTINQITKERETASVNSITKELAAAAGNGPASTALGSNTTTNNVLKEILGGDTSSESSSTSIEQVAQAEAIVAARDALVEQKVGESLESLAEGGGEGGTGAAGSDSSIVKSSRDYIQKLTERAGSSVTNNSTSSSFSDSRSAIDRVTALNQTRQMLQSTSSITKERSVERASENQSASAMQPLDVRYESQVINNVEYVTAEQHRRGLAEAAERGRAMTLQTLQNSVKSRRKVGLA